MSIDAKLDTLIASLDANTAALREILSAGATTPTVTEPVKPAAKAPAKAKAAPAPAPEPEPTPEPEVETPTKVAGSEPAADEFADPLDPDTTVVVPASAPKIDVDAVIKECIEGYKAKLAGAATPEAKAAIKDAFPALRAKWGLVGDAKLSSIAGTPEKLVGLRDDIFAL